MLTIIYEDKDILVLNKPAGIVVNRAQSVLTPTVQDWLEEHFHTKGIIAAQAYPNDWISQVPKEFTEEYGSPEDIFKQRSGIAHRLDKETSGILLVAKHPGSLLALLKQFRLREVQKQYLCLTHGKFGMTKGEISAPIGRRSKNRKLFGIVADGRPAVTQYQVVEYYSEFDAKRVQTELQEESINSWSKLPLSSYNGFSLVKCWPKTGRTHQIRVHMAHLGHPIVGDYFYVGKKRRKLDALWCPRQFLHAQGISFIHPRTKEAMSFEAELPEDLKQSLKFLHQSML